MYVRYIKRTNYKYRYIRCKIQYILTLVSEAARQRGRTFSPSTKACTVKKKYLLTIKLFGDTEGGRAPYNRVINRRQWARKGLGARKIKHIVQGRRLKAPVSNES